MRRGTVAGILLGVLGGAVLLLAATADGRWLARAAFEEGRILWRRRPIARLAADTAVAPATRAKLQLVLAARDWADTALALPAERSFTTFTQLPRDTLLLVLSAARADSLAAHTWWFPVTGRVPYKGFFDLGSARAAEAALRRRGLDTYLRPAAAFSTLGWFDDPLLSTTLAADSVSLVNTVVHELMHNRYYAKGDAGFNESLASWVGARGAERFFATRGDSAAAAQAARDWVTDQRLAAFWATLAASLDSAFAAHPGAEARAARLTARDTVYARARRTLADSIAPAFGPRGAAWAHRVVLNNASVLARRTYGTGFEAFDAELVRQGGDLRQAIDTLVHRHRTRPR